MNLRSASLALILLTLCASLPVVSHDLILDGRIIFQQDGYFSKWDRWHDILSGAFVMSHRQVPTDSHSTVSGFYSYRPLTALIFMVEHHLARRRPWLLHSTSVLWHVLCVLLLFHLGRKMLQEGTATCLGAALFAVHPIHAEILNNAGYQSDQLALLFGLCGLLLLVPSSRHEKRSADNPAKGKMWMRVFGSQMCFFGAALCKETGVVFFPLGWAVLPLNRSDWPARVYRGTVLFGTVLLILYLMMYLGMGASDFYPKMRWYGGHLGQHIGVMAALAAGFFKAMIWPFASPCVPSFHAPEPWPLRMSLIWWASAAALFVMAVYAFRRAALVLWCLCWVVLSWIPVSNLLPLPNPMGLRYLYIPLAGVSLLASILIKTAFHHGARSHGGVLHRVVLMAVGVIIVVFTVRLWNNHKFFTNETTALRCVIQQHPESSWPYFVLARRLASLGHRDEAIRAAWMFLAHPPRHAFASMSEHRVLAFTLLGRLYRNNDPLKAAWFYRKAVARAPQQAAEACLGWIQSLTLLGRPYEALKAAETCLFCCPQITGMVQLIRGHNLAVLGNVPEAVQAWMAAKQAGVSHEDQIALWRWIRKNWRRLHQSS